MSARPHNQSIAGFANPLAGFLCLLGFFLHLVLAAPVLQMLGVHYSGDEGQFYEKIHPGSFCIFLSFAVLLLQQCNPLGALHTLVREQLVPFSLLTVCILAFFYCVARSGAGGTAFLIDTHMTPPIAAMVLCYTPLRYCRIALHLFIAFAAINSTIGIGEAISHQRIIPFDADWRVLHEDYFRASALGGHPLNNAMITAIALFTMLALRYPWWLTAPLVALNIASLVAFGGRAALAFCSIALLWWCGVTMRQWLRTHQRNALRWIVWLGTMICAALLLSSALYVLIETGLGTRIAAHGWWDVSAHSRRLAPLVLGYMKPEEILLGVSMDRMNAITAWVNQQLPLFDIENPWLLMLIMLGAVVFSVWLAATVFFIRYLLRNQLLAAKLAVIAYFAIASTSNSFGRKDSNYLIMVCAVTCLARKHHEATC